AWALTILEDHPGRPEVGPFLRGVEEEEPQTTVAWRADVPLLAGLDDASVKKALVAVRLRPEEILEAPTREFVETLQQRVRTLQKGGDAERAAGALGEAPCLRLLVIRSGAVAAQGRIAAGVTEIKAASGKAELLGDPKDLAKWFREATVLIEP